MLTKRIIPCLDVDSGRVVKGTSFINLKDAGDPVELASYYYHEGADEIVFLDIVIVSNKSFGNFEKKKRGVRTLNFSEKNPWVCGH